MHSHHFFTLVIYSFDEQIKKLVNFTMQASDAKVPSISSLELHFVYNKQKETIFFP
jgi:hypothetical protein